MILKSSMQRMNTVIKTSHFTLRPLHCVLLGMLIMAVSCTTTRKKDEVKGLGLLYENMTAHYNGYFNATEIMKESEVTLQVEYKDNFNQILPVFEYTAIDDPKSVASNLDEAIKKASVVISMHRPSKWTDDCYLLIGQAQYLKQDYESAQKTLEYMVNNFDETGKSKEKAGKGPSKAQTKAARQKEMQAKIKEAEARKKNSAKDRKERNKEIEDSRKTDQKTRKTEKKERDKANKLRDKERKKYNAARKKSRKKGKKKKLPPFKMSDEKTTESDNPKATTETKTETTKATPLTPIKEVEKEEKQKKEKVLSEKQKAKEAKIKDGAMAHAPAYPYGVLWLAKTYVERDFVTQADRRFKQALAASNGDKELMQQLYPSMAHFYIYNEQYNDAIIALEQAIEVTSKNATKGRYAFIIGQLKMRLGQKSEAVAYFDQAAGWAREYEMQFNAKMNSKLASMASGTKSQDEIAKELEKMGKDDKNTEYLDQIYFQIAKVYLEANDIPKAEEYLQLALDHALNNKAQKTEIHFALGEIYFSKDLFIQAYDQYSLAFGLMSNTDSRYGELEDQTIDLKEIATHLRTVNLQDSLLMLAGLSDEELKVRAAVVLQEKATAMAEAQEKVNEMKRKNPPSTLSSPNLIASSTNIPSKFFAYNEKELKKGIREFDKTWGSRPLIDDWRRKESGDTDEVEEEADVDFTINKEPTGKEVEDIFATLPRTEQAKEAANKQILDALYNLGMEYRNKIERLDLSSAAFERFATLGQRDSRLPEAYYYLYLNAQDQKDFTTASKYAKLLQDRFADSKFALITADPGYMDKLLGAKNSIEDMYQATYEAFQNEEYQRTFDALALAKNLHGTDNKYISKFALLQAMSVGKLKGKEEYINSLRTVVAQYANTPEQIRAREIIRFLGGDDEAFENEWGEDALTVTTFKTGDDDLHYVIVALYNEDVVSVDNAKLAINNYNGLFHKLDKFSVRSFIIDRDKKSNAVLIRKFDNRADAMKYYKEVNGRMKEFLPQDADAEVFAVSQFNYREMIKSGSASSYLRYFKENYLRE